ncbi:MAG: NAD(P)-binding domain-containing protein [Hyphomicrobiaceae bacterium]|nr:NAD(P)-binding domain-containing protein [Hyphomicrobiaceae bacterium]
MTETIGWIGIGSMGHRMSRHLVAAGHQLVVADAQSTERAPPGATVAQSNTELAALADTVILSLPDGTASLSVARDVLGASPRKAKTVIDTPRSASPPPAASPSSSPPPASSSWTPRCRVALPAPTRPRSPSCSPARRLPTSA